MNITALKAEEFNELKQQIAEIREALLSKQQQDIVYDNQDVMQLLKVSQRTLATWREEGVIKYSKIGAKIYYKPEHIHEMLDNGLTS